MNPFHKWTDEELMGSKKLDKYDKNYKAIRTCIIVMYKLQARWNIKSDAELLEIMSKYDIFRYISINFDYLNTMGIEGVLRDIEGYVKYQSELNKANESGGKCE